MLCYLYVYIYIWYEMRCRVHTFQWETHVNRLTKKKQKKHYVVELFLIKILIKIRSNIHIQQYMFDNGRVSHTWEGRMNILNMIKLMFNVVFPSKYLQNISKRQNGSKKEEEAGLCYVVYWGLNHPMKVNH